MELGQTSPQSGAEFTCFGVSSDCFCHGVWVKAFFCVDFGACGALNPVM